jgi:hypothetical protein
MPKVFRKDGKPDRVATNASQETAFVFDGYREVKYEDTKAPEQLPDAELLAKAEAQGADVPQADVKAALDRAKADKPKPSAPKQH